MRLPFKIDKFEFDLATCYEELTTGEFFALRNAQENNVPSMLAALSGVPEIIWDHVNEESTSVLFTPNAEGWFPLKYLYEKMDWDKMPIPDSITIQGNKYSVGKFLPTLKQKYLMVQAVERQASNKDRIDSAIEVLAMHFQPIVSGNKFSIDDSIKFQEHIKKTLIVESFPLATFFLLKLYGLENAIQSTWVTRLIKMKQRRESKDLKPSESGTQLMPLPVGTYSNTKKFGTYLMKLCLPNFGKARLKAKLKQD